LTGNTPTYGTGIYSVVAGTATITTTSLAFFRGDWNEF
jgi:hypothetical protein